MNTERLKAVTYERVAACFTVPFFQACLELDVSQEELREICRAYSIKRYNNMNWLIFTQI